MARTTVKATYSLSPDVVARLERLALTWNVSKSKALARAIDRAAAAVPAVDPIDALRALQHEAAMSPADADAWARELRAERRAGGRLDPAPARAR